MASEAIINEMIDPNKIQEVGLGGEPIKLLEIGSFTIIKLLITPNIKHNAPTTNIVIPNILIG